MSDTSAMQHMLDELDKKVQHLPRVFEVKSESHPDDDNIAPDVIIKPVDWSTYTQILEE